MVFMTMDIGELTVEQTRTYYPMLTQQRKNIINDLESADERAVLFCGEILARKCLSELLDAPEFSFQLLCNPNSKSIVGNYSANISIAAGGTLVGCAAGKNNVGIGIKPFTPFSFSSAQKLFTDAEIRTIYSGSNYSFSDLINMAECKEENVLKTHAMFSALKEAYFSANGRGFRSSLNKISFEYSGNDIICSDPDFSVVHAAVNTDNKTAVAVIERKSI